MRIINVRELKVDTKKVLGAMLLKGPVLITRRGKPIALMRGLGSEELAMRFGPLWDRIRLAAERAGYKPRDVGRLVASIRSKRARG